LIRARESVSFVVTCDQRPLVGFCSLVVVDEADERGRNPFYMHVRIVVGPQKGGKGSAVPWGRDRRACPSR
jgi:hypothetical protein